MSADLALAANPAEVERAADPGEYIVQACERAKTWLREALDHGDIDQIVECKSQADAIRIYTMSKQLGKDAQLSATEIVRRAERGIGLAIRRGQESGEISRGGSHTGNQYSSGKVNQGDSSTQRPTDFATKGELYGGGNGGKTGIYALADEVTDADFENALTEAKADGDLSRTSVVRRLHRNAPDIPLPGDRRGDAPLRRRELIRTWAAEGYSSRQMSERLGMTDHVIRKIARETGIEIPADAVIGKTHNLDPNRILRETVHTLEGLVLGVELLDQDDLGDLDSDEINHWATSLTDSIRVLNRLVKSMRKAAQ